mgnify:CR=1 FL=1
MRKQIAQTLLFGGVDNDRIAGNTGDDVLFGDAGADTFVAGPGQGFDVIFDFNQDEGDILEVNGINAADLLASATQIAIDFSVLNAQAEPPTGSNVLPVESLFDAGLLDDLQDLELPATNTATSLQVFGTVIVLIGIAESDLSINSLA